MATYEIFSANVPTSCVSDLKAPLHYLEKLAFYQVMEATKILSSNSMKYTIGWYGRKENEHTKFQLLLDISDATNSEIFRIMTGLVPLCND